MVCPIWVLLNLRLKKLKKKNNSMRVNSFIIIFLACIISQSGLSQGNSEPESIRFMFYNVENLFDTEDDSITVDEEFLPNGMRYWTKSRYYTKINQTFKTITAVGQGELPALVGLCEIENRAVLDHICFRTPLKQGDYSIIHQESTDFRGIDVALLYRKAFFKPYSYRAIRFALPDGGRTRDILYTAGVLPNSDTLHLFINHWPSRRGGQSISEPRRVFVASQLRRAVDSIFVLNPKANILISGDFNDYPENRSLHKVLAASFEPQTPQSKQLYNLAQPYFERTQQGTHKMYGLWGILDQVIVSGGLLESSSSTNSKPAAFSVFAADYLLEPDEKNTGFKPFRTYLGFRYAGGFSDHLPVYLDINLGRTEQLKKPK